MLLERFLSYVKIDTQSDESAEGVPSTKKQFDLARKLEQELIEMGLQDVSLDEHCYVMAKLPSNQKEDSVSLGLIAHMDTSPDMSGKDVKPILHKNYDGEDILLPSGVVISKKENPFLQNYIGQTVITTDGTTLLGADDKAGVTVIMEALHHLATHPEIPHGTICVAFTPDEEIGRGADFFDVQKFGADVAYTIDGGEIGELEYESFNAASAKITVHGKNVHPGSAKDVMVNSILLANELALRFPVQETPQHTEGYEGFYHLNDIQGSVEVTTLRYIIRDFDRQHFEERKQFVQTTVENFAKEKNVTIDLEVKDQYYNMGEIIKDHMELIEIAKKAFSKNEVEPKIQPIRGGTDGSRLSYMGLPTPNIFTGGHNYHGKLELVPLESMEKCKEIVLSIIDEFRTISKVK